MPDFVWPWMHLIGRILFSMVFIGGGMAHLFQLNSMSAYAQSRGVPASKAAVVITGLMIVAGGVMVLIGWRRFIGAGLLVIFLFSTALMMHPFWKETDPTAKQNEMSHFLKDLALAGAALFIAYNAGPEWPMSVGG